MILESVEYLLSKIKTCYAGTDTSDENIYQIPYGESSFLITLGEMEVLYYITICSSLLENLHTHANAGLTQEMLETILGEEPEEHNWDYTVVCMPIISSFFDHSVFDDPFIHETLRFIGEIQGYDPDSVKFNSTLRIVLFYVIFKFASEHIDSLNFTSDAWELLIEILHTALLDFD